MREQKTPDFTKCLKNLLHKDYIFVQVLVFLDEKTVKIPSRAMRMMPERESRDVTQKLYFRLGGWIGIFKKRDSTFVSRAKRATLLNDRKVTRPRTFELPFGVQRKPYTD